MIVYELTRGLANRGIRHRDMHWYTTTIPLALTLVGSAAIFWLPSAPALLGKDGLIATSLAVVATLPGFYFAGLAAVATFNGINMDAVMPAPAAEATVRVGDARTDVKLSRRQFLSYLFSYLVLVSFAICGVSLLVSAATPSLQLLKSQLTLYANGGAIWQVGRTLFIVAYVSAAASMLVTTLHGMFFLTERIHQP